ncbi:MAG: LysM peptidoglycan-binding domain-containing protein [Chloroflexia bacterium]
MQARNLHPGSSAQRILLLLGLLLPALVLLSACAVTIGGPPPTPGPGEPTNTPISQIQFNVTPVNSPTTIPPTAVVAQGTPSTIKYTIKPGDALSVIAQQYGTTVEEIVKVNNISDPNQIKAGDVILVPVKGGAAPTRVASPTATPVR